MRENCDPMKELNEKEFISSQIPERENTEVKNEEQLFRRVTLQSQFRWKPSDGKQKETF